MGELLVGPLFELDVHGGVEGTRVHGLGGRQVDVLDHVGGHTLPQLLLQDGLPGRGQSSGHTIEGCKRERSNVFIGQHLEGGMKSFIFYFYIYIFVSIMSKIALEQDAFTCPAPSSSMIQRGRETMCGTALLSSPPPPPPHSTSRAHY